MRDATAYSVRLLFADNGPTREVFAGKRSQGGWSLYFDEDPVLQFKSDGSLRRLHFHRRNYAAENGQLRLLERAQRGGQVSLKSSYNEADELQLRQACLERIVQFISEFECHGLQVVDRYPQDTMRAEFELIDFLRLAIGNGIQVAENAHA